MNLVNKILVLSLVFFIASSSCPKMAHSSNNSRHDLAFSLYGGRLTDDNWRQSISGQADFVDSDLIAAALGWTFYRPEHGYWTLELEGNLAKHFGNQDHWEINAPLVAVRWHLFPWNKIVDTSMAYGIGPSYTTSEPKTEKENEDSTSQFLLFWHLELTLGPPLGKWAMIFRLHHRSTGFGLFGDDGGANALTVGIRYFF